MLLDQGRVRRPEARWPTCWTQADLPLAQGDGVVSVLMGRCSGFSPSDLMAVYDITAFHLLPLQSRCMRCTPGQGTYRSKPKT